MQKCITLKVTNCFLVIWLGLWVKGGTHRGSHGVNLEVKGVPWGQWQHLIGPLMIYCLKVIRCHINLSVSFYLLGGASTNPLIVKYLTRSSYFPQRCMIFTQEKRDLFFNKMNFLLLTSLVEMKYANDANITNTNAKASTQFFRMEIKILGYFQLE